MNTNEWLARNEIAAAQRPDELTRLNSEVARLKLALRDTETRANLSDADAEEQRTIVTLLHGGLVPDSDCWQVIVKDRDRIADSFRALRSAWFGRVLRQDAHEREWENKHDERRRTDRNTFNRREFDAVTEQILRGRQRIVSPVCMADVDKKPES